MMTLDEYAEVLLDTVLERYRADAEQLERSRELRQRYFWDKEPTAKKHRAIGSKRQRLRQKTQYVKW